ncbi:MAG: amidohydrolase family protein, partial [Cloacibacillus sp.]
ISRYCGHFHAVNSRGLKESGLWDKQDVNIPRNDDGSPKGQLTEGAAGEIIETISSIYEKPDNISALVEKACIKLASMGITMVHACDAPSYALGEDLAACQRLDEKDALPIRWACYHDELPNYQIKSGFGNEKLFVAGFKIFADGTLGGRTCAMREDFSDDPGNKGLLNHSDEEMAALLKEAQKRGVQVQIHTIGDKALEQTINSIKAVIAELGEPALPYRINHAIVCPADLLAKIKEINAVVDIQPIQAYTDRNMTPLRVGDE